MEKDKSQDHPIRGKFNLLVKQMVHGLNESELKELTESEVLSVKKLILTLPKCSGKEENVSLAKIEKGRLLITDQGEQILPKGRGANDFTTGVFFVGNKEMREAIAEEKEAHFEEPTLPDESPSASKDSFFKSFPREKVDEEEMLTPDIDDSLADPKLEEAEIQGSFGLSWIGKSYLDPIDVELEFSTWCDIIIKETEGEQQRKYIRQKNHRIAFTLDMNGLPESRILDSLEDPAHKIQIKIHPRRSAIRDKSEVSYSLSVSYVSAGIHAQKITGSSLRLNASKEQILSFEELHYSKNTRLSHVETKAVGINASATWREQEEKLILEASFWPKYDEYRMDHREGLKSIPSLKELEKLVADLKEHGQEQSWNGLNDKGQGQKAAEELVVSCQETLAWFAKEPKAYDIFVDAATAVMSGKPTNDKGRWKLPLNQRTWRPFQIILFLSTALSSVKPEHARRKEVAVIEFPTGSGKTEAYLLLAAFTILYLRSEEAKIEKAQVVRGAKVLMRYPLRLLATQQFTRAATVVSKLNIIISEKNASRPGYYRSAAVHIGLWAGSSLTPNSWHELRGKDSEKKIFPQECPLCGSVLEVCKKIANNQVSGKFGCLEPECFFGNKNKEARENVDQDARVFIIDSDIYTKQPEFLIATSDKIATLTWRMPEVAKLINASLNLVIQDELHMLDDELGSLEGIYQMAMDKLSGANFKIVAASATTKNTKKQVKLLYGRDNILKVPAAEPREGTWFAAQASKDVKTTVVGILPGPRVSSKKAYVRILAAQAQAGKILLSLIEKETAENERAEMIRALDPFWTNLVFFGSRPSLREVSMMFEDEIMREANSLNFTFGYDSTTRERAGRVIEASSESPLLISDIIKKLEIPLVEKSETSAGEEDESIAAVACLATSMVEVGVDVDRLGLMTFVGQPKEMASYIQASGRVGRKHPALIYSIYRPQNPRDKSFFEDFQSCHERITEKVEPALLAPFAIGSVKRALPALVATYTYVERPSSLDTEAVSERKVEGTLNAVIKDVITRAGWANIPLWLEDYKKDLLQGVREAEEESKRMTAESDLGRGGKKGLILPMVEKDYEVESKAVWYAPTSLRTVAGEAYGTINKEPWRKPGEAEELEAARIYDEDEA